jgi:hypothetical protein
MEEKSSQLELPTFWIEKFTTEKERPISEQIASLQPNHKDAFDKLKTKWNSKPRNVSYTDEMILRFLRASPGDEKFNVKSAYKVMKHYADWSIKISLSSLTIDKVRRQLESQTLLIPGCISKDGHQFLYMKPGLYFPQGQEDLDELIRSLIYLLERMVEKEKSSTEGISFMANMDNWTMSNFSINYAKTFFDTMQGRFPCRIRLFLIVNPPSWFSMIWRLIRPMMSSSFASKVFLPTKEELPSFIQGNEDEIPQEFGGKLNTSEALENFIKYRYIIEGKDYHDPTYKTVSGLASPLSHKT